MSRWLVPVLLLAALAIGAIWFFSAFERVPAQEWVGPSSEARRNPYLAAERFAGRMGLATRELRSLPELDTLKPGSVLLLPSRRQAIDPRRRSEILAWVKAGGYAIAEAELVGVADPLLDELGVQRLAAPAPRKPVPLELPGARKLAVSIFGAMTLQAAGQEAARFVTVPYGKGSVSVLSGLQFARNGVIGTHDNAEFLWQLMRSAPVRELQVYLRPERLSLWGFLREHAASVLAASAALLAFWLWRVVPRFGPVPPDAVPGRRRLLDHLRASGRYYWASGLRLRLVAAARDAALHRVARAQPDFAGAGAAERAARLCAIARIAPEEAQRFLAAGAEVRGAELIRIMHTAQRIHSAMEKGNRQK
jgi:hypothetical protein